MATTPQSPGGTIDAPIEFRAEVVTDPVGFAVEASVADRVPPDATQALVADVRERLVGGQGNLLFQAVRVGHGTLRSYGGRLGYDIEPVTESVEITDMSVKGQTLTARVAWTHPFAKFAQFGVSPHTINGTPILSFIYEGAPQEVREMFPHTERVNGDPRVFFRSVDHPGIPASRYVQAAINWLRQELT